MGRNILKISILLSLLAIASTAQAQTPGDVVDITAEGPADGAVATWPNGADDGGNVLPNNAQAIRSTFLNSSAVAVGQVDFTADNPRTNYYWSVQPLPADVTDNTFSLEAWINPQAVFNGTWTSITAIGNAQENKFMEICGRNSDWGWRSADGGVRVVAAPAGYLGSWHHLVVTYDGATAKFYENGVERLSEARAITIASGAESRFRLSGMAWLGNGSPDGWNMFRGRYARVSLHSTALTPTQVLNNYNAESAEFTLAPIGRLEVVVGAVTAFGNVAYTAGTPTLPLSITIKNTGTAALDLTGWTDLTGTGFEYTTPPTAAILNVGDEQVIGVRYAPAAPGTNTGTITFTNTGETVPFVSQQVALSGTAHDGIMELTKPSKTTVNVGEVNGDSIDFYVTNAGYDVLPVTSISLTGGDTGSFTLSGVDTSDMAVGERRKFTVTFAPSGAGEKSAVLGIVSAGTAGQNLDVTLRAAVPHIYADAVSGNDANDGSTKILAVKTLVRARNLCSIGGVIELADGTYTDFQQFLNMTTVNLRVKSTNPLGATLDSPLNDPPHLTNARVVFEDVNIDDTAFGWCQIYLWAATTKDLVLKNCHFTNKAASSRGGICSGTAGDQGRFNIDLINTTFENFTDGECVGIEDTANDAGGWVYVDGCTFQNNNVDDSAVNCDSDKVRVEIYNSNFLNNTHAGNRDVRISRGRSLIVSGCSFVGNKNEPMIGKTGTNLPADYAMLVDRCFFSQLSTEGEAQPIYWLGGSEDRTVTNCIIEGGATGIRFTGATTGADQSVANCTVIGNNTAGTNGIYTDNGDTRTVSNCIVLGYGTAVSTFGGTEQTNVTNPAVATNLFLYPEDNSTWAPPTTFGADSFGNPLNDYHPTTGHFAVSGQGTPVGLDLDFDGIPWRNPPDIGALQSEGNPPPATGVEDWLFFE